MKQTSSNQKRNNNKVVATKKHVGKIYQLSVNVVMLLLLSIILFSCSDKKKEAVENPSHLTVEETQKTNDASTSTQMFEIVPNEKVCMVNDRYMGIPQILIDVNGTHYYGCCENCVEKLQKNLNDVRFGNNPLDEVKVDKASAIVVRDKSKGSVFYFGSKEDAITFIRGK